MVKLEGENGGKEKWIGEGKRGGPRVGKMWLEKGVSEMVSSRFYVNQVLKDAIDRENPVHIVCLIRN